VAALFISGITEGAATTSSNVLPAASPYLLVDRAVSTSAGAGFRFDSKGRFTHLFDPATGRSPSRYSTLSVIAPTATEADALSTAFSLMPVSRIQEVAAARANVQVRATMSGGNLIVCGA
jgi:thiamine biosynthesis lipoprotein